MKYELPKQINLETSYQKAAELLRTMDINTVIAKTGAEKIKDGVRLTYFDEEIVIKLPEAVFTGAKIPIIEQILVLHYLTGDGGHPCSGALVKFKNLPGGSFYQSAYRKRGPNLILRLFGNDPKKLIPAGKAIGGEESSYGDASVTLRILPKITADIVLYAGDEEFPPDAAILHPDSIINFLTLEDIALLAGMIYKRLKAHSLKSSG